MPQPPVLRDTFILIDAETAGAQRLTAGYTVIYPGCRSRGHHHDDLEEVYYFLTGEGIMQVGEDKFPVRPGDAVFVPVGPFHTVECTSHMPMTYMWVTTKLD